MNNENQNNFDPNDAGLLEQQLLELHYGLLDDSKAQELRARIETDSTVAMKWAKTLEMAGQFASAANLAGTSEVEVESFDNTDRIPPIIVDPSRKNRTARNQVEIDINGKRVNFETMSAANALDKSSLDKSVLDKSVLDKSVLDKLELGKSKKAKWSKEVAFNEFKHQQRQHRFWVKAIAALAACFLVIVLGRFFTGIPASPRLALRIEATTLRQTGESSNSETSLARNQFEFFTSHLNSANVADGVFSIAFGCCKSRRDRLAPGNT